MICAVLQAAIKTEGALTTTDADQIVAAFQQYVIAQQQLLAILITKAGLFAVVPSLVQPVGPVLQSLQPLVDSLAYTLCTLLQNFQSEVDAIKNGQASLDITLSLGVQAYA